jgi:L-2,4-diaminobutyrate decarboxylase
MTFTRDGGRPGDAPVAAFSSLAGTPAGMRRIADLLHRAAGLRRADRGPLPAGRPRDVLSEVRAALGPTTLPARGLGEELAFERLASLLQRYEIRLASERVAAHLQAPPLALAVAADTLASATNASVDTFDSGPAGLAIERWVIRVLCDTVRFGPSADGVMTPGGSISNLMALLLARDTIGRRRGVLVSRAGASALPRPVVFCSRAAHFSVHRACAAIGLGEDAVRALPTDRERRLVPATVDEALCSLAADCTPVAIVATAGTTDFGSIDPLRELAEVARRHGVWLHVDAAYGFGALFSERLARRLHGIELADSVTLDLHKLGWQPAATSILLVSHATSFDVLKRSVQYLNPEDDTDAGYDGLLGRSLQTTRRADGVKVAATFLGLGREGLGRMVDACHALARHAEQRIGEQAELELVAPALLSTVCFRFRVRASRAAENWVNGALRRHLIEHGEALIGRTSEHDEHGEHVCLKLTFINPFTRTEDVDAILSAVIAAGRRSVERLTTAEPASAAAE